MTNRLEPLSRALAALLALGALSCPGAAAPPAATVATAEVIRGQMSVSAPGEEEPARVTRASRVEAGGSVATAADARGGVRLDTGAWLLLDRSTEIGLQAGGARLARGRLWVDASTATETTVETGAGSATAAGATFAVAITEAGARLTCGSGEVTYRTAAGDGRLQQGESVELGGQATPRPEPEALWDDWTGGLADPSPRRSAVPSAVGRLAGRPLTAFGEARAPLPVRGHEVRVSIQGDLARTEVVQTFFNARSEVLEAEYAVRLPEGAIANGFAIDRGDGFVEGQVCSFATTAGYELAWNEPEAESAALSYDGPGRLRARIHPVAPGATVRVRLSWSEWLERHGRTRTYLYPMGGTGEPPLLGELSIEVGTSQARAGSLRAGMGARTEPGRVLLRESDFRPRADFVLELVDPAGEDTGAALALGRAHVVESPRTGQVGEPAEGTERYVLFDLPTDVPGADGAAAEPPLELVILVDVSGGTDPEGLELSRSIVESALRQLAPTDRVALLLGDVTAHPPEGASAELAAVGDDGVERLVASLARVELGGATDLGRMLLEAAELVAGRPRGAVLYVGDGLPTTGRLTGTELREVLASIESPPRFFGLGVGEDANVGLLQALFRGRARAVGERTEAARSVMEVLAEAARPTLGRLAVDLGPSVERVYPRGPLQVPAEPGRRLRLVGRLRGELPERVVLTGERDGRPFERVVEVRAERLDDGGDIRRRWATSRLEDLLDEDAGREALVELGVRFEVLTPWTSLVVGSEKGSAYGPVLGFDHDPVAVPWALGGGAPLLPETAFGGEPIGWRRRARGVGFEVATVPESTWSSRFVDEGGGRGAGAGGEESLARAAASRALARGDRGPRGCFERRLGLRPELAGVVGVSVEVEGSGAVRSASVTSSTLSDAEVEQCVLTEVRGLRFPETGASRPVTVRHSFHFEVPSREIGVRQRCSDAARQPLEVRRALWRERLAANAGHGGALAVYGQAAAGCELGDWRARRTLLDMMLQHVGGVAGQVRLYRAFGPGSAIGSYLARAILRRVRTPQDVALVRQGLGLEVPIDWGYFSRLWREARGPEARLRLVRRWLEAIPDDVFLRLRLLALLEETGRLAEARRLARELRADPLADAQVRTVVGEFWLRQEDEAEARRVWSEIVERAPLDPWARRRLGDLYLAHGWADDAYGEYQSLARLRAGDPAVVLLLARAAASAGRLDEALRLEQRLSESVEPGADEGAAAFARLWTATRLARLRAEASPAMVSLVRERERSSGALRDPPALFVAVSWDHPDDWVELHLGHPSDDLRDELARASLRGGAFGIEAERLREREDGVYVLAVRRPDREGLRTTEARLLVVSAPGSDEVQVLDLPITLGRERDVVRLALTPANELVEAPRRRER